MMKATENERRITSGSFIKALKYQEIRIGRRSFLYRKNAFWFFYHVIRHVLPGFEALSVNNVRLLAYSNEFIREDLLLGGFPKKFFGVQLFILLQVFHLHLSTAAPLIFLFEIISFICPQG